LVGFRCKQVAKIQTNIQRGLRRTPQISRDSCQLIPWCKVQRNGHGKRTLVPAACPDCSFLFFAGDGVLSKYRWPKATTVKSDQAIILQALHLSNSGYDRGCIPEEGGTKASIQFWWVKSLWVNSLLVKESVGEAARHVNALLRLVS